MRSLVLGSLLALAAASLTTQSGCSGCGGTMAVSEGRDILAGLEVATEGQMETQAVNPYVWARPTSAVVFCIQAPCPSYEVRGVDGSGSRFVHQFDLRALGISQSEQGQLMTKMGNLLTRGRYVNWRMQGQDVLVFQITRYAEPHIGSAVENPLGDRYYQIRITDACANDACIKWQAKPLDPQVGSAQVWDEMDFSPMKLTGPQLQVLMLKLRSRGGYVSKQVAPAGLPLITQAFPNPQ